MLIDWYEGAEINNDVIVNNLKYNVKFQIKIHTAECLLQGSVYFSVYHNLSLILIIDIHIS